MNIELWFFSRLSSRTPRNLSMVPKRVCGPQINVSLFPPKFTDTQKSIHGPQRVCGPQIKNGRFRIYLVNVILVILDVLMFSISTKYSCIISVGNIPRVNLIMTFAFCTYTATSVYNYMLMYMLTLKFFFAHKRRFRLRIWNIYKLNSASQAGVLFYMDF